MHTVRFLPVDPPTTPATSLYYVGFTDAAAAWTPFVSCASLHEAMQVVSFLNGGQRPSSLTPWTNCMDTSGAPVSNDFRQQKHDRTADRIRGTAVEPAHGHLRDSDGGDARPEG
jgi:hypothetical protein